MASFEPGRMMEVLAEYHISDVLVSPAMIQLGLEWLSQNPERSAGLDLSALATLRCGASPVSRELLRLARAALPAVRFSQAYGATELAPLATVLGPQYHDEAGLASGKLASVGRPAPMVDLRVVDDAGADLPPGVIGEIIVRGPNVMLGYWNDPAATAQALRDGWFHTGDLGYLDREGFLFLVDRLADRIVCNGEYVYPAEVERVLRSHPAVARCAVSGVADGKGGTAIHAVVVARTGALVTADALREHCRARLAVWKVPQSVALREALQVNAAGKPLRGAGGLAVQAPAH
jgi:long-chain acyl-CoA synthetase